MANLIKNVLDMVRERGDTVPDDIDIEENASKFLGQETVIYTKNTAIIFYLYNDTINQFYTTIVGKDGSKGVIDPADLEKLLSRYQNRQHYILVVKEKLSSGTLKNAREKAKQLDKLLYDKFKTMPEPPALRMDYASFQLFEEQYLRYNPAKHNMVPKHIRLTKEESKKIKELYSIKLPIILSTDIMARWMCLRHGDIVMIIRNNPNSGTYYYYRICA